MSDDADGKSGFVEVIHKIPEVSHGAITHYVEQGLYASEQQALDAAVGLLLWASEIVTRGEQPASYDGARVILSPIRYIDPNVVQRYLERAYQHNYGQKKPKLRIVSDNT